MARAGTVWLKNDLQQIYDMARSGWSLRAIANATERSVQEIDMALWKKLGTDFSCWGIVLNDKNLRLVDAPQP
jgi:hypothetical protein